MTNPSRRHHYLPKLYLKAWRGPEGCVLQHPRRGDRIEVQKKAPRATGFLPYLNRIERGADPDALETKVAKTVDDPAAKALQRTLEGSGAPRDEDKEPIARFLVSLLSRHPDEIERRTAIVEEHRRRVQSDDSWRMPEWVLDKHFHPRTMAQTSIIDFESDALIEAICRMRWIRIGMPERKGLVTTDRPLVVNAGVDEATIPGVQMLSIALSPTDLLWLHPVEWGDAEALELVEHILRAHLVGAIAGGARMLYSRTKLEDGRWFWDDHLSYPNLLRRLRPMKTGWHG